MKRLVWIWCVASVLLLLAVASAADRPNVVFVITDDQGYGDLGCHGNPIVQTPNIDKLHGESLRFTNYHVSPTCTPTRGALMSGHFTNRAGTWHTIMGRSMLLEGETTLGEVFGNNGYATGMFGKWHLGDNYPFRAEDRGFQEVVRHGGGGVGQTPDLWNNAYFDDTYLHNGVPTKYEGFCSDVYFQEAKRFIEESVAANKPFFAYISTNAPHGPFHCPDKFWKKYVDRITEHRSQPDENGKVKKQKKGSTDRLAVFYGMIENIDDNVGSMRTWLAEKGLEKNTIFVFTTDNGSASGGGLFNSGMRGTKGSELDGGHRVPLFMHWPEGISQTGDVDRLCAHIDVLPTLVEVCGIAGPENYKLDGVSLKPLIEDPASEWPDRTIITDSQRVRDPIKWRKSSTMTQRWRLVNGKQLYDIEADPAQRSDVASGHPDVVAKLKADYDAWWDDISPVFEKDARIIVGHEAENPSRLTCHDWLTSGDAPPWNQSQLRKAQSGIGHWALKVVQAGKYRISLRRWDGEGAVKDLTIGADVEPGDPVEGLAAYRETPGMGLEIKAAGVKIGDLAEEKAASSDESQVVFEVALEEGEVDFTGYFVKPDDEKVGAFYAFIEKL